MNKSGRKKLVLVKPPEHYSWDFGAFSLGVLAAGVRHLVDVSIIDAGDMIPAEAAAEVWSQEPDVVGITLMGLPSVKPAIAFLQALKSENLSAGVPVIVGGHGAAMLPEELLKAGADCVAFGEGELTLQDIIENGISPGMPGTAVLVDNRLVKGPMRSLVFPLDRLKEPARDLMALPRDSVHLMETSRGCPHSCEFCETTRFYGTRWRPQSPQRVLQEVNRLIEQYNAWLIHIVDDNFTASPRRTKEICRALIEDEALPLYFMFFARADDLIKDPEVLPLMAKARMLRMTVGIDTLDPGVGEHVKKTIPLGVYRETFERMREVGMFSIGSLIIGLPGETPEARGRAVERLVEAGPDFAQFLPYIPMPGLPRDERHIGFEPHPDDMEDANRFTREYLSHPAVIARLEALAEKGDVQGKFAQDTLKQIREGQRKMQEQSLS